MADIEKYEAADLEEIKRQNEEADAEYWKQVIEERRYESDVHKD